ncbi:MAG TPA: AAA family ATPase [Ilumatobacter sp.]
MASRVETVTVMFTDVVGSTELRSRVGEDEAERLRLAHDAILGGAVDDHGGTVVKHLGDGAMATFPGAAGAIAAAVAIQQGLERFNRDARRDDLRVRIGISAGDVSVEGDDYFGLPVVEAQRLEASAAPSTIRCSDLVKQLSRGRGDHEFEALGPLELKGLAEPLQAFEVRWAPLADPAPGTAGELPPVLTLAGGMPFSGRAEALGELLDLAKGCSRDGFATALVAGEPGIGKTRLAHELALRLVADGGRVIAGRCDEDIAVPYQAVRTALDWHIGQLDGAGAGALGVFPGDLVRLVPDLAERVGPLPEPLKADPEAERYRLLQAVESWLRTTAQRSPTLLVLDDLHWADKATLVLLQHLIRAAPPGLMIVCTYRDTDVDRSHPLASVLADLRRLPKVERIALGGLPIDEIREFLERAGGWSLDAAGEAFAQMVARETAGNPFFVSELLRHFTETGMIVRDGGRWTSEFDAGSSHVPEGIREVVGRRLGRLGDEVEDLLRAASVIGYEFGIDLLAAVMDRSVDEVIDALDVAVAANLVVEVGVDRFRFSHALVRETLHDELSSTRRARQHRKVAVAIEALHERDLTAVVAELATHWREATVGGDPTRAIELAVEAGEQALVASAPDTAANWFAGAIDMMEDDPTFAAAQRRTMVRLATAQILAGDVRHRSTGRMVAAMALEAGDTEVAVAALTLHWRTSYSEFEETDAVKIDQLRTALRDLDLDDYQRADLTGELATELIFERDIDGRRQALSDYNALTDGLTPHQQAQLLASGFGRFSAIWGSDSHYADQDYRAALGIFGSAVPHQVIFLEMWSLLVQGDRAGLDRALQRWLPVIDAQEPFFRSQCVVWRVPLLVMEGDLVGAGRLADELLASMRELQIPERSAYRATTVLAIGRETGDLERLLPLWARSAASAHPSSPSAAATAFLHLVTGTPDGAEPLLDAFDIDLVADDAAYPMAVTLMGEVAAAIGTPDVVQAFLHRCEPGAGLQSWTGGLYLGSVNRLLGLLHDRLGDHDEADRCFASAVDEATVLRSPPWLARTQLDIAESCLNRADTGSAQRALDAARAALVGVDLPASSARLAALSDRAGAAR